MSEHYQQAGVSLEAGYESVERISQHTKRTFNLGTMSDIGSFGALFDLHQYGIQEPVLVSGTDGVGTKLKIAFMLDRHDTIGIDAVAMCVNDILAQGAMPLFFLDYLALGKNVPAKVEQIVKGVADGCVQAGCALIGGETAEWYGAGLGKRARLAQRATRRLSGGLLRQALRTVCRPCRQETGVRVSS